MTSCEAGHEKMRHNIGKGKLNDTYESSMHSKKTWTKASSRSEILSKKHLTHHALFTVEQNSVAKAVGVKKTLLDAAENAAEVMKLTRCIKKCLIYLLRKRGTLEAKGNNL